jgi:hypothetical protein
MHAKPSSAGVVVGHSPALLLTEGRREMITTTERELRASILRQGYSESHCDMVLAEMNVVAIEAKSVPGPVPFRSAETGPEPREPQPGTDATADGAPAATTGLEPPEPTPAQIRKWGLRQRKLSCPERGRLPETVIQAYKKAHPQ